MVRWGLALRPDSLSSVFRTHMVERENLLLQVVSDFYPHIAAYADSHTVVYVSM